MKDCSSVSALADELGVHRTILYQWQRKLEHIRSILRLPCIGISSRIWS